MAIEQIKFYKKNLLLWQIPRALKFLFSTVLMTSVLWRSFQQVHTFTSLKQVNPIFDESHVWYVSWVCAKVSTLKIGSRAAGTKGQEG